MHDLVDTYNVQKLMKWYIESSVRMRDMEPGKIRPELREDKINWQGKVGTDKVMDRGKKELYCLKRFEKDL